ncbi:MAG: hypothetical protein ACFFAL_01620 [Promethearchaeota archaeon]
MSKTYPSKTVAWMVFSSCIIDQHCPTRAVTSRLKSGVFSLRPTSGDTIPIYNWL